MRNRFYIMLSSQEKITLLIILFNLFRFGKNLSKMNYYKIPLVRRLASNLRAKNQNFKLYRYGESGGAWFQCYGLDLSLIFTPDGYTAVYRLGLSSRLHQGPQLRADLFHYHNLPRLGLKLQNLGFISDCQAAQIFEVETQALRPVVYRMAA